MVIEVPKNGKIILSKFYLICHSLLNDGFVNNNEKQFEIVEILTKKKTQHLK